MTLAKVNNPIQFFVVKLNEQPRLAFSYTLGLLLAFWPINANATRNDENSSFRETRYVEKLSAKRVTPRGEPSQGISPRIVGGETVTEEIYPWMVSLLTRGESDGFLAQFCGASLIHPYWVLTAAHCVEDEVAENIDVVIGETDLDAIILNDRIEVVEIIMHPQFDPLTFDYDVALLRLATPSTAPILRLNSDVNIEQADAIATVLGWGALDEDGNSFPTELQEVMVPLVDSDDANTANRYNGDVTDRMIAAGNLSVGGVDSCQGDSGGPLVLRDIDGEWALAGISSFGEGCARPDFPGIYTRISQFRSWALQYIMPEYNDWEINNDVFGEMRDFEGDRLPNFGEFALGQDPRTNDGNGIEVGQTIEGPFLRFTRPDVSQFETTYKLAYRADFDASDWTYLDFDDALTGTEKLLEGERLTFEFPEGEHGFIQVELNWAPYLSHTDRPMELNQFASSALTDNLQFDTTDRPFQDFLIQNLDASTHFVYGVSFDFDMRLELYRASDGMLLQSASDDNYGATDERIEFTYSTPLILRVLPDATSGRGYYTVLLADREPSPSGFIGENETFNGTLTSDDAFDPEYFPSEFYHIQDFVLQTTPGFSSPIVVNLFSNQFDTYLQVVDIDDGSIYADNDDANGSTNSELTIQPFLFGSVIIRVSSFNEYETGSFRLETRPE